MILDPKYDIDLYRRAMVDTGFVPHRFYEFSNALPQYGIHPKDADAKAMGMLSHVAQMNSMIKVEILRGSAADNDSQIIENYHDRTSNQNIILIRGSQVLNGFVQALFGVREVSSPELNLRLSIWRSEIEQLAKLRALVNLSITTIESEPIIDDFIYMYASCENRITHLELHLRNNSPVSRTDPLTSGKYN